MRRSEVRVGMGREREEADSLRGRREVKVKEDW